ncbi:hypothetical protein RF11_09225 [Thelohanellus kitauei]|uniref:Calcineurin-like phosphoesterase domain-containing protein n=1 Tax=Thelohanellus kitauei TaxID=669202 RepID=A0A0C2MV42_THEKT|nr:hypothetical protein RF11_09225 [Thelohanellus kitauei]
MELNVVVIGDIGIRAPDSVIKQNVVRAIELQHQERPFRLGINLGGNEYPHGSAKNEFINLRWIFELSFPVSMFPFDFLTVPGAVDYQGDVATQIKYHWEEHRFYMPQKNYYYGLEFSDIDVVLRDRTSIRFVCIDSTPLYETRVCKNIINRVTRLNRFIQLEETERLLDNSVGFDFVFLIMHHNVVDGCGPHTFVPNDLPFMKVIKHRRLAAILTAYNHNMQIHGRLVLRPPVITVGNSAQTEPVTYSNTPLSYKNSVISRWCKSPQSGGYGQLIISKQSVWFNFIDGNGEIIHQETINPVQG